MEAVLIDISNVPNGRMVGQNETMIVELSQERKIRVVGVDGDTGRTKEYFLKVTERKGLVLV